MLACLLYIFLFSCQSSALYFMHLNEYHSEATHPLYSALSQRQRHITLVERLKSHTATSEALVMSQAKLA